MTFSLIMLKLPFTFLFSHITPNFSHGLLLRASKSYMRNTLSMEDEFVSVKDVFACLTVVDLQLPNLLSLALGIVVKLAIHNQYSEIHWQSVLLDCRHISCFVPSSNFSIKDAIQ